MKKYDKPKIQPLYKLVKLGLKAEPVTILPTDGGCQTTLRDLYCADFGEYHH